MNATSPAFAWDELDEALRTRIKFELSPGEVLLWAGRPLRCSPGPLMQMPLMVLVPTIAALAACLGLLAAYFHQSGQETLSNALALAAVLLGIGAAFVLMVFVGGIQDAWESKRKLQRTTFALTDRRAIFWQTQPWRKAVRIVSYPAHSIGHIHRIEYKSGIGDVIFTGNVSCPELRGFLRVGDVRTVEDLTRQVLLDPNYRPTETNSEYD